MSKDLELKFRPAPTASPSAGREYTGRPAALKPSGPGMKIVPGKLEKFFAGITIVFFVEAFLGVQYLVYLAVKDCFKWQ